MREKKATAYDLLTAQVDQRSSRVEPRFARQQTNLESLPLVLEHIYDVLNQFLRETHGPVVDFGGNRTEVNGGLMFGKERFMPLAKFVAWRLSLTLWVSYLVAGCARNVPIAIGTR